MTAKTKPLAWAAWESPDRVIVRPDMKNETGNTLPRLLLIPFANGALKVTATRRPLTMLSVAAGVARAMNTWIDSALVSDPDLRLGQVAQILTKRLRLDGHRYIGEGVFEKVSIGEVLPVLVQIRPIADLPEAPIQPHPESTIPAFLKKEHDMPSLSAHPVPRPASDGLIPVFEGTIGGVACSVCDARTLHTFLEVGKDFTNWVKDRIAKYQFVKNQDFAEFTPNLAKNQRGRGRPSSEYHLTLDMAKELSMVENNEKGRQARRYFIECERKVAEALAGNHAGGTGVLPDSCEQACDARAWFLWNQLRDGFRGLLTGVARDGDEERFMDGMFFVKSRIHERLRDVAIRQLAQRHDPKAVAAWIMNWTPDKPAFGLRMEPKI